MALCRCRCLPCGFESRLVQDFQRNIMFLPSQSWDIVKIVCPWVNSANCHCGFKKTLSPTVVVDDDTNPLIGMLTCQIHKLYLRPEPNQGENHPPKCWSIALLRTTVGPKCTGMCRLCITLLDGIPRLASDWQKSSIDTAIYQRSISGTEGKFSMI